MGREREFTTSRYIPGPSCFDISSASVIIVVRAGIEALVAGR